MENLNRRDWLKTGAAAWVSVPVASAATATGEREFAYHHDHLLGTSFDLLVSAPDAATADAAENAALHEIERLRRVLSIYDPASELSHLNRTTGPVSLSADLSTVLRLVEEWRRATGGAFDSSLLDLTRLWRIAEREGREPSSDELAQSVRARYQSMWNWDSLGRFVRPTGREFDVNALGKAYILDRAVSVIRREVPSVSGVLLDLGGDVRVWGRSTVAEDWVVGIQDPFRPYDNVAPIGCLRLSDGAVASSGGYLRQFTIDGRRHSHIFDPRTGRPAVGVAGATVVASDAVTANALATALCVLAPDAGLRLVAGVAGAECLIVASDGGQHASPGLRLHPIFQDKTASGPDKSAEPKTPPAAKNADAWPQNYEVAISLELPKVEAKRYRKPYVAVWIEDEKGVAVRTLGVWGNAPKYLKDLSDWWKIGRNDRDLVKSIARATRGPGKYNLIWDGKDEKGTALPQGKYTVRVEVHREFGSHLRQSGKIECGSKPAEAKLEKNAETAETLVQYRKAEKK